MKKICVFMIFVLFALIMAGCGNTGTKTVKIGVIGDEAELYPGYKNGIQKAAEDLRVEYVDTDFDIEYEFHGYDGSYEEGAAIVDMLAEDDSVTAVIGAINMDLNKTAAYVFNEANKVFVVPFFLQDSVFQDNHYDKVFSMCNSGNTAGELLRHAAAQTTARRWAICASDREFERSEMNGFLRYSGDDGIFAVDCVSISELEKRFDEIYARWETLGVEGVVILAEDTEGFDLLKKIKSRAPDMICAGDTAFDNTEITINDPELLAAMDGFIMVNEFIFKLETDEEIEQFNELCEKYYEETGEDLDLWYIQGYNAVRMIADTAVRIGTAEPQAIADALHSSGYSGMFQDFSFDKTGALAEKDNVYSVFDATGYTTDYMLDDGE